MEEMCIRDRIDGGTPVAKATVWAATDAHSRKRGEQIGLDTLVAVSYTHLDVYKRQGGAWLSSARVVRCWVKSRNERNPYPQ